MAALAVQPAAGGERWGARGERPAASAAMLHAAAEPAAPSAHVRPRSQGISAALRARVRARMRRAADDHRRARAAAADAPAAAAPADPVAPEPPAASVPAAPEPAPLPPVEIGPGGALAAPEQHGAGAPAALAPAAPQDAPVVVPTAREEQRAQPSDGVWEDAPMPAEPVAVGGEQPTLAAVAGTTGAAPSGVAQPAPAAPAPPQTGGEPSAAAPPPAFGAAGLGGLRAGTTSSTLAALAPAARQPPPGAPSSALRPPATDLALGLSAQSLPGTQAARRASAAPAAPALDEPQPLVRFVRELPPWAKLALAGLGLLVLLLACGSVLQAVRTRRLERQRARLLEDVGLLQSALLPAVPARLGSLLTTVAYRPADGPGAGGDFYDAFALADDKVGLLLGDVSGHGRQALAKTTLVRFTVRAHLEAGLSPREALTISGRSLDGRLADDFATVIAAVHDPVSGTLTYASAGHPAPIVVGPAAQQPISASSAPPLAAGFPTGQRQSVLPMPAGTTVCIYSDGLVEARVAGEPLGHERLARWLHDLGPRASAKQLLDLVVQRADRISDDLAACVLHAAPGAMAPAARVEQLKLDVLDVDGPDVDGFLVACGVPHADRRLACRRAGEQLAITSSVVVEVRLGARPMVSVAPIGAGAGVAARSR